MIPPRPPVFLENGTFLWDMLGYSYADTPPKDLRDPTMLSSKDPWMVLAATLEQAKAGNHEPVGRLAALADFNVSWDLARSCLTLLGDAGTASQLVRLTDFMLSGPGDYASVSACDAALHAGYLWLAPYMLEAWNGVRRNSERDAISAFLSMLLEETPGPILANEGYTNDGYNQLVTARISELEATYGTDQVVIFAGKPFSVVALGKHMLKLLRTSANEPGLIGEMYPLRHRFEASTGINCSSFFRGEQLRPLSVSAVLETFLESPDIAKYKEGGRYFFGHRIPTG